MDSELLVMTPKCKFLRAIDDKSIQLRCRKMDDPASNLRIYLSGNALGFGPNCPFFTTLGLIPGRDSSKCPAYESVSE